MLLAFKANTSATLLRREPHAHTHTCSYRHTHTCSYRHTCAHTHTLTSATYYEERSTCTNTHMLIQTHMHTHMHMHTHTHTHTHRERHTRTFTMGKIDRLSGPSSCTLGGTACQELGKLRQGRLQEKQKRGGHVHVQYTFGCSFECAARSTGSLANCARGDCKKNKREVAMCMCTCSIHSDAVLSEQHGLQDLVGKTWSQGDLCD